VAVVKRHAARVALGAALALGGSFAWAAPLLHEFLAPDPREDVSLGALTVAGGFPATIETPSGLATAPDMQRPPSPEARAYANTRRPEDALFRPDRDTRQPPPVPYEDPFSPAVTPYKRLQVFDAVGADYALRVAKPALVKVAPGGAVAAQEEAFFGEMTVDLAPGEGVRIPTPGPGARALRVHTVPAVPVELAHDGAENWFARSTARARVRLLVELAVPRASFGALAGNPRWADLPPAPALPAPAQKAAESVNALVGVSRQMAFRDALGRLVAYYRSFAESDEPAPATGDIFVDLAKSKKGVCRHRAFAFVVSALGLGVPARLVTNEAHAWVEVHDGTLWHRIDLGGAAAGFEDTTPQADRIAHRPPPDPFPWPERAASARDVAEQGRPRSGPGQPGQPGQPGPGGRGAEAGPPGGAASSAAARAGGAGPGDPPAFAPTSAGGDDPRPPAQIALRSVEGEVFRNQPLHVEGRVEAGGNPCPNTRVDVVLVGKDLTPLGSLATDEAGAFRGAVTVPASIGPGRYELTAQTPGDARCGPGRAAALDTK
jgi:transglutaminase-like putative cysteine protease